MTREEAIKCLKVELHIWESDCKSKHAVKDALKMAITALEQESCEDAVNRKDIYFKLTNGAYPNESIEQFIDRLVKELEALPPVTPQQPRKGHWKYQTSDDYLGELNRYYECSECGRTVGDVGDIYAEYPYCHCGAKMVKDGEK